MLRATAHIIREDGYDALSTNKVAERAGVSIGSLYQYFPSKDALLLAVAEEHAREMSAVLMGTLERLRDAPMREVVRTFIRTMIEVHALDPKLHTALTTQIPRMGGWAKVKQLTAPGALLVRGWLAANASRCRAPLDLDVATFMIVTAVEAITHAALEEPDLRADALVEELTELVLRYLGAEVSAAPELRRARAARDRASAPPRGRPRAD